MSTAQASVPALIGSFQSRALVTIAPGSPRPTVILLPGSGPNGPEEQLPGSITLDGKDVALFGQFSAALQAGGFNTIALGKPGVEFVSGWKSQQERFYNRDLWLNLRWRDLLSNLRNAIDYALTQPGVDPNNIYVLGHSEGTQVAVDYAKEDPRVKGIILLGFSGQSLGKIVDWQQHRRLIEYYIAPVLDKDGDGVLSAEEAKAGDPEIGINWAELAGATYAEIEAYARRQPENIAESKRMANFPLYFDGIYTRPDLYSEAAALRASIYAFNGAIDCQTPASEIVALKAACDSAGKADCEITIVPEVGHGFSAARGLRQNSYLDATIGPARTGFLQELTDLAKRLAN